MYPSRLCHQPMPLAPVPPVLTPPLPVPPCPCAALNCFCGHGKYLSVGTSYSSSHAPSSSSYDGKQAVAVPTGETVWFDPRENPVRAAVSARIVQLCQLRQRAEEQEDKSKRLEAAALVSLQAELLDARNKAAAEERKRKEEEQEKLKAERALAEEKEKAVAVAEQIQFETVDCCCCCEELRLTGELAATSICGSTTDQHW